MNKKIVIVGGGIAGYTAALKLANSGNKVVLIEKEKIGGTCLNKGCIPTKYFLYSSSKNKNLAEITFNNHNIITKLREGISFLIQQKKIEYINDEGIISSDNSITLKKSNDKIEFDILILAIGSEPSVPEKFKNVKDSLSIENVFELEEVPKDLIIIGGGYIGIELASIFSNLGSKVTIIEKEDCLLPNSDKDVSDYLTKHLRGKGIQILTGNQIKSIENNNAFLSESKIKYDKIIFCTGRKPAKIKSDIQLEEENGVIKTNEFFETSKKNIFAIGDVLGGKMFAHKAEYDANILADNIIKGSKNKPEYSSVPSCVFGDITFAQIGEFNKDNKTIKVPFGAIGKSYCDGSTEGFLKISIDNKKRIIGAQIVNKNATEVLAALIIIINNKLSCEKVANMMFAHPTPSEIIKEAAKRVL